MLIRSITPNDNPHLASIIRESFIEFDLPQEGTVYTDPTTDNLFSVFNNEEKSKLWVAELDHKVVGSCGIYPTEGLPEGYVELVKFYLSEDARGKGVGKTLIENTIESARKLGYTHLYLESFPELERAVAIYYKLGFERIDHSLGQSGHVACSVWMTKKIV